ncbi:SOS response-associated peptidase [Vallitalea okinawensis]|uniref:SOS response-associated peptidase n=1 Tax=Vallitalea okinawensis TaxID=2078660 RepID=UPI000CFB5E1E|nr:SOS response-associated peptidase [Vallitalea okinawensis]
MCGRFLLTLDFDDLYRLLEYRFNIDEVFDVHYSPRYNIAPSQPVLSVIHDGNNYRAGYLRWGFIPHWAKDEKIGYKMINARAETIDEKASYKHSFIHKRCLILSNGFYEWKKTDEGKEPRLIRFKNNEVYSMAGLYSIYRNPQGEKISSCTIITTEPNDMMQPIHNRMPVLLGREQEKIWLDPTVKDPEQLKGLLKPYPSEEMYNFAVSSLVNSPKNDSPKCIEAVSA